MWCAPECARSPQTILEEVDNIRAPGENFGFSLEVVHAHSEKDDPSYKFQVRVKDKTKSLVKYMAPPSARGRMLLMLEKNMWIYIPGTRRAIRISPQQQLLGQISNADVARVVYSVDYQAEAVIEQAYQGADAYRVTLKSRDKSPYQRIELFVSGTDCRPLNAEFYALSGRLIRTVSYHDYREVAGRLRPMRLEAENVIKKGERTFMHYSDLRVVDTPDSWFQKNYLPRLK